MRRDTTETPGVEPGNRPFVGRTTPGEEPPGQLRSGAAWTGWLVALLPLGLTIGFASLAGPVTDGARLSVGAAWAPSLGVDLAFSIDGLSLLFALLISGVGTFVFIYAGAYLAGHPQILR